MIDEPHLATLVERRAEATPDALFAVDDADRALSFADYRARVARMAAALARRGVGPGSVVSWQLPTTLDALVLTAALSRRGAVQNPVLPFYREREVGFIVAQLAPGLLVVPGTWRGFDHEALARDLAARHPGLDVATIADLVAEEEETDGPVASGAGAPGASGSQTSQGTSPPEGWVFYTSGTTGEPKGVRHADAALAAEARAMVARFALRPDDRVALVFPLTHIGGIGWLLAGLMAGCAQIVVPAFDPEASIPVLARHGVTQGTAGTVFHQAYLAAQRERPEVPLFPRARAFPGGGAPKPPSLHYDVKRELGGVGIVSGYGMTECPVATLGALDDPDEKLAHTEGRASEGVTLRIVRPDGSDAGPDEEGEIRVRGPQLCLGYVDPALDAEAFDEGGLFRSGDLGRLDAEGHLVVTGRIKDVIIRKGENVSAKEVEDALFAHPAVAELAVVGVPDPDTGERVCAVVVPARPEAPPALADLVAFLREAGLAAQKCPERLEIVAELPRNAAGKVLKHALRARYG